MIKNKEYVMNGKASIIYVLILLLNSCVGDQKNINKETNEENPTERIKRDRTPNTPRINIPTNTF